MCLTDLFVVVKNRSDAFYILNLFTALVCETEGFAVEPLAFSGVVDVDFNVWRSAYGFFLLICSKVNKHFGLTPS